MFQLIGRSTLDDSVRVVKRKSLTVAAVRLDSGYAGRLEDGALHAPKYVVQPTITAVLVPIKKSAHASGPRFL
jgi:hypothetical protein